jgi:hypothetical protein
MFELALGSDPGRTRTHPSGDVAMMITITIIKPLSRTTTWGRQREMVKPVRLHGRIENSDVHAEEGQTT